MAGKLLVRPVVPDCALRRGKHRVRRRPHGEALVREDNFDVDAVGLVVLHPVGGVGAGFRADPVLALKAHDADAVRTVAFAIAPLHAVRVGLDARHAIAVLLVDALHPKVRRFVRMAVSRDHEVFLRVIDARGPAPALNAGRVQTPKVLFIDGDIIHSHFLASCAEFCMMEISVTEVRPTGNQGCGLIVPLPPLARSPQRQAFPLPSEFRSVWRYRWR